MHLARHQRHRWRKELALDGVTVISTAAGVEFTNGDQPGVRLTRAAAARPTEVASAPNRRSPRKSRQLAVDSILAPDIVDANWALTPQDQPLIF